MTLSALNMRRARLMKLVNFSKGRGLEIGPLHSPIVTTDVADVCYVDVFSQDQLRANYANDSNVNVGDIPEMHFVLSGPEGVRSLSEAVRPAAPFDWVVASHVVEHVPDVISWLAEIAKVLDDGGQLLLVVPDRRFSFDIRRPSTTVGQMLQSYELQETRPSVRAVYDLFRNAVTVAADAAWRGEIPGHEARIHGLAGTMGHVQRARDGEYVDCHVWTFTPASFVEQIAELGVLELCDFVVERIVPTAQDDIEFYAVLRRLPRGLTRDDLEAAPAAAVLEISDTDPVSIRNQAESARLTAEIAALHGELDDHILAAGQRTKALEDELAQVKASERWRLGGLAAVPASVVKRFLVR
jgi:SAM-dependent methyltransferase